SGDYRTAGSECKAAAAGGGAGALFPGPGGRYNGTPARRNVARAGKPSPRPSLMADDYYDSPTSPSRIDEGARRRVPAAPPRRRSGAPGRPGHPEPLAASLPPEDAPPHLPTLEELVHIEIEFAWQAWGRAAAAAGPGAPRRPLPVGDYLARFPRLNRPGVVL